jgi:hypothetical protein
VIIEPGTVNTAMYDKGEKEDLSEPINQHPASLN